MATFKVWLTVKDNYGNTKELDGGNITLDLEALSDKDISRIGEAFLLEEYLKKSETDYLATDKEVEMAIKPTVKYGEFKFRDSTNEVGK